MSIIIFYSIIQHRACGALVLVEVSDNSLRTLATSTFRDMSKLETLNLAAALDAGCRLEAQLFHGLTALENLYLNGNKLASLEPELFCQLQSLVILDLSRNNLSRLEPGLGIYFFEAHITFSSIQYFL